MTHVENRYAPHWLDAMLCEPGSHDAHIDNETLDDRDRRIARAKTICGRCPVDQARCLINGRDLEASGVYGGRLLYEGHRVNHKKAS